MMGSRDVPKRRNQRYRTLVVGSLASSYQAGGNHSSVRIRLLRVSISRTYGRGCMPGIMATGLQLQSGRGLSTCTSVDPGEIGA